MRHPVSTPCYVESQRGAMAGWVVGAAIDPHAPQDANPSAGQNADGVWMIAAAGARGGIDTCRPSRSVTRVVGETSDGEAQAMIAGPAEGDAAMLAGLVSQRRHAGLCGQLCVGGEALALITELGEDLSGADAAGARQRHDDLPIGELSDGVFSARGELSDLFDQRTEGGGERLNQTALGVGFE